MKVPIVENASKNRVVFYDDTQPICTRILVSNETLTRFRANSGGMARDMKKYVAVIYEIEEEV